MFIVLPVIITGCGLSGVRIGLEGDEYRRELIAELKAFEASLGFSATENFQTYSEEMQSYDYYFYAPRTRLPYSLDDPLLQFGTGKPENASVDLTMYDVFTYSIEALAHVKTPTTRSLLQAPLPRLIHVVLHEDWHEQMDSVLGIEEPSAEVVSYQAALLFTADKFGRGSAVYESLKDEFDNKLKESRIYSRYYDELSGLYALFNDGHISEAETLSRKSRLIKDMADDIEGVWGFGARPSQLNNAFIAFQMTYLRHFPLMYQVYSATNSNLLRTMAIFRSVPEQGAGFSDVAELRGIEDSVTDYLRRSLSPAASFRRPVLIIS